MAFHRDLSKISLEDYVIRLKQSYLIPSQRILLESIEERFKILSDHGLSHLGIFHEAVKTKKKLEQLQAILPIPEQYLTVLRRTVNSLLPPPRKLSDFKDFPQDVLLPWEAMGIKDTKALYQLALTESGLSELEDKANISRKELLQLICYADFTRIPYVNATFSTLLVHSNYGRISYLQKADPKELFQHIKDLNRDKNFFKGQIGQNDMVFLVQESQDFTEEMNYSILDG